jgi:hypothetical protein
MFSLQRKPINVRKKSSKKTTTGELLNIRPNMTIQQVADLMGRDTGARNPFSTIF